MLGGATLGALPAVTPYPDPTPSRIPGPAGEPVTLETAGPFGRAMGRNFVAVLSVDRRSIRSSVVVCKEEVGYGLTYSTHGGEVDTL